MNPLKLTNLTPGKVYRSVINGERVLILEKSEHTPSFFGNKATKAEGLRCNPITGEYEEIEVLDNLLYDDDGRHDDIWHTDFVTAYSKPADEIMVRYGMFEPGY